jgi:adenine-specific DNA-methyltransferase
MYITKSNAERVDFIRNTVEAWSSAGLIDEIEYYYLLASLIEGVSFVSNITGTYGAYLKEWDMRALKSFEMARLSVVDNGRANHSYNTDANKLIREIDGDILYIDPPYNSRQYAPNYHLLETISRYDSPSIKGVTGMRPYSDTRSAFCVKSEVLDVFEDLIARARFTNIVASYSTDGLMTSEQIECVFKRHGIEDSYKRYDIPYRKYRSKISNKTNTLREYVFYVRKNIPRPNVFVFAAAVKTRANPPVKRSKYLKSPLNYIGGKYRLLPQILPLFPRRIGTFVDLFAGGCNVGINVRAELVICNDLNTKIIDMFKAFQQMEAADILRRIEERIHGFGLSKENERGFISFRDCYNRTQDPIDLYILTCYSFNYQFRFNNNFEYNNPFGRNRSKFSGNMRNNLSAFLKRVKSADIKFTSRDFTKFDVSARGYDDIVYCDPPYLITTGSYNDGNRGFKGWKETQELTLYALLDRLHRQGVRFALSNVLTHKSVRNEILLDWCKKYAITKLDMDYSNSSYNTKRGSSTEVLITNY